MSHLVWLFPPLDFSANQNAANLKCSSISRLSCQNTDFETQNSLKIKKTDFCDKGSAELNQENIFKNGNLGFVIQINDFDRPFFGRFEKQNGRNWPWIKVIKQSLSFFLFPWGKKIKKSYKNLSTNQNASFPILEFCAKKGLKWKLVMHWFQN